MREDLPTAARGHPDWPVRLDHCFGRIILDEVCGRPWREAVAAPAWRNLPTKDLVAAIALADAILDGRADLVELNAASLRRRRRSRVARDDLALSATNQSVSSPVPAGSRPAVARKS